MTFSLEESTKEAYLFHFSTRFLQDLMEKKKASERNSKDNPTY